MQGYNDERFIFYRCATNQFILADVAETPAHQNQSVLSAQILDREDEAIQPWSSISLRGQL